MWIFLTKVMDFLTKDILDRLDIIIQNQHQLKEKLVTVFTKIQDFATAVNALTNQEAADVATIVAAIEALKGQLANAPTEEAVSAILDPTLAQLTTISDSLKSVAANNQPNVPPPPPPVEPL